MCGSEPSRMSEQEQWPDTAVQQTTVVIAPQSKYIWTSTTPKKLPAWTGPTSPRTAIVKNRWARYAAICSIPPPKAIWQNSTQRLVKLEKAMNGKRLYLRTLLSRKILEAGRTCRSTPCPSETWGVLSCVPSTKTTTSQRSAY